MVSWKIAASIEYLQKITEYERRIGVFFWTQLLSLLTKAIALVYYDTRPREVVLSLPTES